MERAINQSRRSHRSRVTQEQDESDAESSDETIPTNADMEEFEALSEVEVEPEEIPAWKTPLPENAPPEAKDPRFYGNVPAVWTQRI